MAGKRVKNEVQTFAAFNKRCRRPNRKAHIKACGYDFVGVLDPQLGRPKELAMTRLHAKTEATGKCYHGVYIQDVRSVNGDIGYSLYAKEC
tara:strand:- start:652 stop:924 length:273 start_codon:yes stop_codon:yes gene_type:complete